MDPKSKKTIFVGYPEGTKGFKLFDLKSKRFIRSRDVILCEQKFHNFENESFSNSDVYFYPDEEDDEENVDAIKNTEQVGATYEQTPTNQIANLLEKRQRQPPKRLIEEDDSCNVVDALTADIDEPKSLKEAINGEYYAQWKKAANSELNSLLSNDTWELVPAPEDKNIVGNRWVFKVKRNADGSIDRFKARLVAKGFSQKHGIDYQEVFAPVVRYNSIRSLLAFANHLNLDIHQMDVKTAFLQGEIDAEVYMEQPDGFINKDKPDHV